MERRLRAGVIGVGAMGNNHARIYSELLNVELAGIADIDERRAASVAHTYGGKAFSDYTGLLDENLDAVTIAVPTILHGEVALQAIRRGVNVLIEKPIAHTIEFADEVIGAANNSGVKLMVGHVERFNPAIIRLKELISAGELGDIISISAKRLGPHNPRIRDVGVILDIGTHDIDIMSYLYGERIREVYAVARSVAHNYEDYAVILLNLNNGRSGVIETNWLTPHKVRRLTVTGSKGIAEVDYPESSLTTSDREWSREAKIDKQEPLKLELEHFIDCIRQNIEPSVSGETGRHTLEVALAAIESYRTGKVCEIK